MNFSLGKANELKMELRTVFPDSDIHVFEDPKTEDRNVKLSVPEINTVQFAMVSDIIVKHKCAIKMKRSGTKVSITLN